MSLLEFHPAVAKWFSEEVGQPTSAQLRGWRAVRERRHTLIAAPTGSGKTLAAFLVTLDDLFKESLAAPLPDEVRVIYVSPLKALRERRHSQESRRAEAGHPYRCRSARPRAASPDGGRSHRRQHAGGTGGDAPQAAAHPGHHARVAGLTADGGTKPADAPNRADGGRRRDPRRHRHAARRPPCPHTRAAGADCRAADAASRPVGHPEADRGGRALSRGDEARSAPPAWPTAPLSTKAIAARSTSRWRCRLLRSKR